MIAFRKNSLAVLSDSQLINKLDRLVRKEREATLEVLQHIIEFDRRKLYLGIGYGSLYDYCTLHLGYSGSGAVRRIRTARAIIDYPEVYRMLKKKELSLDGACKLAGILNQGNKNQVLQEARCKSTRQIEAIVARHKPGKEIPDRVKTVFVGVQNKASANTAESDQRDSIDANTRGTDANANDLTKQNWVISTTGAGGKNPTIDAPHANRTFADVKARTKVLRKKYKLEFAVEPECMRKVDEARAILSTKYPEGVSLGKLLEEALDVYLDKYSSERKRKRREEREARRELKKSLQTDRKLKDKTMEKDAKREDTHKKCKDSNLQKHSRHIPQAVQDEVVTRDKGRCTFMGLNGVRCSSTWNLEIDHIVPYAKGGDNTAGNLRLLCAKHNMHEAEKCYGRKYIQQRMQKQSSKRE